MLPANSSGAVIATAITGSNSVGFATSMALRKAMPPRHLERQIVRIHIRDTSRRTKSLGKSTTGNPAKIRAPPYSRILSPPPECSSAESHRQILHLQTQIARPLAAAPS